MWYRRKHQGTFWRPNEPTEPGHCADIARPIAAKLMATSTNGQGHGPFVPGKNAEKLHEFA